MTTLNDIAKVAHVSVATVSRVLSYDKSMSVSNETRSKIFELAETLNYTKYKTKNERVNGTIGLVTWYSREEELSDLYYLSIRLGIENYLQQNGFLIQYISPQKIDVKSKHLTGVIAIGKFSHQEMQHLSDMYQQIVFIGCNSLKVHRSCVMTDVECDFQALLQDALSKFDASRIFLLTGKESTNDQTEIIQDERVLLFEKYLKGTTNVYQQHFTANSGYQLMTDILDAHDALPQVIFAGNDAMAIGIIKKLLEANIKVPEQVKVIGFDNISIAQYAAVPLTTIDVKTTQMGEMGAKLLLENLKATQPLIQRITVGTELVSRQSY
ncbi:LacI family DNA-binding transcriptional regulator [Lactiplantibacillus modestisalitolerans]|uniref:LacI family DNA-binding transcriptional regulator n=1 Tax=Lactiplantibacillus modestisalitolerans TaxID=1457219 RepID=A0ABV5WUI8_9LACO|nr:LacI family DNA-binding transcriptional regulator [Lactiplantibacillus modestisalitolerans]